MKKVLSLVFAFVICISSCITVNAQTSENDSSSPVISFETYNETDEGFVLFATNKSGSDFTNNTYIANKLDQLFELLPYGEYPYFTTYGNKGCGNSSCSYCNAKNVLNQHPTLKNLGLNSSKVSGYTCFGFAQFAYYFIFGRQAGEYGTAGQREIDGLTRVVKVQSYSVSTLKNALKQAKAGDIIQCYGQYTENGETKNRYHSLIFLGLNNDSSFWVIDGNWNRDGKVNIHTVDYQYLTNRWNVSVSVYTCPEQFYPGISDGYLYKSLDPDTSNPDFPGKWIRSEPSFSGDVIGSVPYGESVVATRYCENGNWANINFKGVTGWTQLADYFPYQSLYTCPIVSFNPNGGSVSTSSKKVYLNTPYGTLPTPTRTGYTFGGWYTAKSGGTKITATTNVTTTADQTLYAQWSATPYTVTFNANGGTTPTTNKTITYGSTYGTLPTPTRTGYTFSGWYTTASGGSRITSDTTVNSLGSHTLYAHWTKNGYTITYYSNGGIDSTYSETYSENTEAIVSSLVPTRSGYIFGGWATSADGSGYYFYPGASYTPEGNIDMYAVWLADTDTYYVKDGGKGDGSSYSSPANNLRAVVYACNMNHDNANDKKTVYICDTVTVNKCFTTPRHYSNTSLSSSYLTEITGYDANAMIVLEDSAGIDFTYNTTIKNVQYTFGSYPYLGFMSPYSIYDPGDETKSLPLMHMGTYYGHSISAQNNLSVLSGNIKKIHLCGAYSTSYNTKREGSITLNIKGGYIGSVSISADIWNESQTGITVDGNVNIIQNGGTLNDISYYEASVPKINGALNLIFNNGIELPSSFSYPETATLGTYIIKSAEGGMIMPTEDAGVFEVKANSGMVAVINGNYVANGEIKLSPGETEVTWIRSEIGVTYNATKGSFVVNDGTTTTRTMTVLTKLGDKYSDYFGSLPVPDKTPLGYTFGGWYTAEFGGTRIAEDTVISTDDNHTLYAHWVEDATSPCTFVGAQIRTTGLQGLRFIFSIPNDKYDLVNDIGTVVMPKKYLGDKSLYKNCKNTVNGIEYVSKTVPAVNIYNQTDTHTYFTVCITNIAKYNYSNEYVAVPYITYMDGTIEKTIYGNMTENISVYSVAKEAYKDSNTDAATKEYLYKNIISVVDIQG